MFRKCLATMLPLIKSQLHSFDAMDKRQSDRYAALICHTEVDSDQLDNFIHIFLQQMRTLMRNQSFLEKKIAKREREAVQINQSINSNLFFIAVLEKRTHKSCFY